MFTLINCTSFTFKSHMWPVAIEPPTILVIFFFKRLWGPERKPIGN